MLRRGPPLPDDLRPAWDAFVDTADALAAARRRLLATLPAGRVEPGPVALGLAAMRAALEVAGELLQRWQFQPAPDVWVACVEGLDAAASALVPAEEVALTSRELDDLIAAFADIVDPLDAFAEAERAWRRRWKVPATRP